MKVEYTRPRIRKFDMPDTSDAIKLYLVPQRFEDCTVQHEINMYMAEAIRDLQIRVEELEGEK